MRPARAVLENQLKNIMKTPKHTSLLATLFLVLNLELAGGQGIILEHLGNADPVNEGFIHGGSGAVGPVTNDLGSVNAWSTIGNPGIVYYVYPLTSQDEAQLAGMDWVLSVTMRIVNPRANGLFVFLFEGSKSFNLSFNSDAQNNQSVVGQFQGQSFFLPAGTGSTYNNYQLRYDAVTDLASFWMNGIDVVNDLTGIMSANPSYLEWGSNPDGAIGQANWSEVSLYVVPEPSAMTLILLGSGVCIYVRTRNKKYSARSSQ
jgi:hypothetical protein